ncbi:hypothetical protein [Microbacterium sp. lyk4-40-TSB-66]|uniref:hypothetical protein n=1 Tax=Microbacterium sp. lyk4-40-TSB-66 TaxID=3040294 RepID=UPI00254CDE69|nr:hypothetical protein [Microbacterium sp. lyk4-40-TSB-66]
MTSTASPPRRESPSARAKRKNRLLTAITLGIAVIICAVVGLGAYAMTNSWWTEDDPVASADQQLSDGQSRFDRAGQDFFNRQRLVTVDLGAPASAADLGLPGDGSTIVDTLVPLPIEVRTNGDDLRFSGVTRFSLVTVGGALAQVAVVSASSGAWTAMEADLRARAGQWGWSDADIATLAEQVGAAARNEGVATSMTLPTVAFMGVDIGAEVTVSEVGSLELVYVLSR